MNELDKLGARVRELPRGLFNVDTPTRFHLYQVLQPYLEHAWEHVSVKGWKVDWERAAKHVLLSYLTALPINDTRKLPQRWAEEIVDWLRDETEEKFTAVTTLLRREMFDVVWDQADQLMLAHDRQYYTREKILSLSESPT